MEACTAVDVIADLMRAFPSPPLAPACAFEGAAYPDADRFDAESRGQRWTQLDAAFLELHRDALARLTTAAYAAYLPAYLATACVPGEHVDLMPVSLLRSLTRSEGSREGFDARIEALSPAQRLAVARALEHLHASLDEGLWKRTARKALASYWRGLLEQAREKRNEHEQAVGREHHAEVRAVFAGARSKVEGERDPRIKAIASRLISGWERVVRGDP